MRDSFVFYKSFLDALSCFPDKVQLQLFRAITSYALDDVDPNLTGTAKGVWALIKPQIDVNNIRYINGCKGGLKKGQGKGNQNARKKQPKTNQKRTKNEPTDSFQNEPKRTKNEPNDNVNVNDNDNDTLTNIFLQDKLSENISSCENARANFSENKILGDEMWVREVTMYYRLTVDELSKFVAMFNSEQRAKQHTHTNEADYKKHLVDWLRYRVREMRQGKSAVTVTNNQKAQDMIAETEAKLKQKEASAKRCVTYAEAMAMRNKKQ